MLERRLYFHIDWLLIAAVGALCAIGLAMIYSTTRRAERRADLLDAALRVGARHDRADCGDRRRLPLARRQVAPLLSRAHCRARRRHAVRLEADGRAALARSRLLQSAALGVRQGDAGAGARQAAWRKPPADALEQRALHRHRADRDAVDPDRAAARSRNGGDAPADSARRDVCGGPAAEVSGGAWPSSDCWRRRWRGSSR